VEWQELRRGIEQRHAPEDPTLPLIVRCLVRVDFLDR
jgi:hypothetical protein